MRALSAAAALAVTLCAAANGTAYRVIETIAGPDGGYDYVSVDSAAQRLFVAREYGVMAIDLRTRKVIAKLIEGDDLSAVLIIPDSNLLLTTNWGANTATLLDRHTGAATAQIATGKQPDAALFEPSARQVWVMNGASRDISVIDVAKARVVATIPLGGKPEAATTDGKGTVYVNIEDTAEVAAINVASHTVVRRYRLVDCVEPTGIAYDAVTDVLMSACHNGVVRLLAAADGRDRGAVTVGQDADGAIFDGVRRLAYIPCNDGTLTIFSLDPTGRASAATQVKTARGARTAALDPTTGRLYLPTADFTKDEKGEPVRTPGTFRVLVVGPQ
jgi:YVTN family beta-propeller protein